MVDFYWTQAEDITFEDNCFELRETREKQMNNGNTSPIVARVYDIVAFEEFLKNSHLPTEQILAESIDEDDDELEYPYDKY